MVEDGRFRQLAELIQHLCWMADASGSLYWYNQHWYEYTGTTPEQMEGWGWMCVHDPERLPKVVEEWTRAIATGKPFDMVFPLLGADGRFRPFLTRVAPGFDEAGKLDHWYGTNTDVSELKDAKERLRIANRHKDEFIAEMAHELRNPLGTLRNCIEVIQSPQCDLETAKKFCEMMGRQAKGMADLVEKLVDEKPSN